jgi:hypothetical protein
MSAMEPLCVLIGVNSNNLTKEENILIESDLFLSICEDAYSDQSGQAFQSVSGQRFRSYPAINSNLSGQHH